MPNFKVIWSLLIEYKISIWTQISCLSLSSGRLLLLPYALLTFGFEQWQQECFTGVYTLITTFHWTSLLQIMFLFLVLLHRESGSTACQHPVNANIHVPMWLLVKQQHL
jgi:hypothetical protein